ncbi:MAG: MBOAT family O-acyltransferase [Planctomycetota bacterium]
MVFDSVSFWLFFAPLLLGWWALPFRAAKGLALAGSLAFYGWWNPLYLPLLVGSAVLDYFVAGRIAATERASTRRAWVSLSLLANLGLLAAFKYTPLLARDLGPLLGWTPREGLFDEWVVPVGISFYTFQTLSYTLDVYRRQLTPARSFIDFALYVAFFPQLVAGPIVRARSFLPQLERSPRWRGTRFELGLYRCVEGLFLKMVVADNLAIVVERVYDGNVLAQSTWSAWFGTIAFGAQIFADFAGYSGIAIGLAMLMGLRFPENFRAPYISAGLSEFWTRWHVTLSSWLRDYLYISLGGNRNGAARTHVNLMLTMLLGGLWHGAAWTFVAWGALHGLGLWVERWLRGPRAKTSTGRPSGALGLVRRVAAMAVTFVFVHITWVFFRAKDFGVARDVLSRLFTIPWSESAAGVDTSLRFAVLLIPIVLLHAAMLCRDWFGLRTPAWLRGVGAGLMLAALFIVRRGEARDFVYFQF